MTAAEVSRPTDRPRRKPFISLVRSVDKLAPAARPRVQKTLIRKAYELLNRRRSSIQAVCLNYGWAPPPADGWLPHDDVSELPDAYGLQLYDRVAGAVELRDCEVLEVGCGRGGGAAYLARVFGTRSMTGLDFSAKAVSWARRTQQQPGLSFRPGDAEALPFPTGSFDAVVNVESSHCYPHMDVFLDEVRRVLRPGGAFLLADLRLADRVDRLREQLAARFVIEGEEDLTTGVVRALELDAPRRVRTIERLPRLVRPAVGDFFATPGSEVFGHLSNGGLRYLRWTLRTPQGAGADLGGGS